MDKCTAGDAVLVMSDTSTKNYTVSFTDVVPTCTCVASKIGRNRMVSERTDINRVTGPQSSWCKHISRVYDQVCHWRGELLLPEFHVCPECGDKTEPCEEMSII